MNQTIVVTRPIMGLSVVLESIQQEQEKQVI